MYPADLGRKVISFRVELDLIPVIDKDKCTGCGDCREACPPQAIEMKEEKAVIVEKFCEECGECVKACPEKAISLPKKIAP